MFPLPRLTKYDAGLLLLVSAYIIAFSFVTLMRLYTFRTYVDLGIFSQALSSTFHGKLFYETPDLLVIPSGSLLGTHFSLLMFLLIPFYLVHQGPETLLVVQTVFIGLGAVPIYLTAQFVVKRYPLSLGMASLYLLNPAIQSMNIYDFHLEAFLPFFLAMFYYSLLRERWRLYFLFLGFSLIIIEFAPVMVFAICSSYLLSRRVGIRILISSPKSLFTRVNRRYYIPLLTLGVSAGSFYSLLLAAAYASGLGTSPQRALGGFLPTLGQWLGANNELKLVYWALLLATVMFLPFLVPTKLFMVAPWIVVTVVTTTPAFTELGYQHAGAFVAPYLILASIHAIYKINRRLQTNILVPAILLFCIFISPLNPFVQPLIAGIAYEDGLPIPTTHDLLLHRVIALVPTGASILTQNNLFTYFSNSPDAYLYLPNNTTVTQFILGDNTSSWYKQAIVPPVRWQTYASFGVKPVSDVVIEALSSGKYGIIANAQGVLLLEKGYSGPPLIQ